MLNKIDILSGIDDILLCVAYEIDGRRVESWPSSAEVLARATAGLRALPGLGRAASTTSARSPSCPRTRGAT